VVLGRTLDSLCNQGALPSEIIIIDASDDDDTHEIVSAFSAQVDTRDCRVRWQSADVTGAAAQRNQGVALAAQPVIAFFDDDILFETDCIARLWDALQSDIRLGGVNAMIVNQRYQPPGRVSRLMFRLMAGRREASYAGRVLGPAVNLLPEDRDDLPEVVPVEWLNLGCTLYRREALPQPTFPKNFTGYSLMEDLSLSLSIGKEWKLANARTARIYHDSQPGSHKDDLVVTSKIELVNRYYVMTNVMGKHDFGAYARFALWELFQLATSALQKRGGIGFWRELRGKWLGVCHILNAK
jgi:glycosyltransferase involved in cell wall biosynthesis